MRYSRRLAAKEAHPILRKAVELRARREEVESYGEGKRSRHFSKKKIPAKSANYGVSLNEGELSSFVGFETLKG